MTLATAAIAVLNREARLARAEMQARPKAIPSPTPNRPAWWDLMSPPMRDLAEAAIDAGLWSVPEQEASHG